jgi:hypothetical protein
MPNITTTEVTPAEIREGWDSIQSGKFPLTRKQESLAQYSQGWKGSTYNDWIGCSGTEMQDWLHNGYWPDNEDMPNLSGADVTVDMPAVEWDEEEGDMIYEAVLNNEDLMFVKWDSMPQARGMKIQACFDFNAGVSAETMREYFAWMLGVIERAESLGIAPDVELFIDTQGSFQGHDERHDRIAIPVVKAGEVMDTVAWRAYLTKGGFRTLGFLSLGIAGDKLGLSLTGSLGRATGNKWDITHEDDVLTIHAPGNANGFPKAEMNKKLEDVFSTF